MFTATRRNFLSQATALAAASVASSASAASAGAAAADAPASPVRLGVASYSLRKFDRARVIEFMKVLRAPLINLKDMHLPWTPPEETRRAAAEFRDAGLTITGAGVIGFDKDDDEDMRKKFEYVKTAGIPLIIGMPSAAVLPRLEKFVKEYNIKVAIHNHGPEDKNFPSPFDVLKAIKNLDPRIGLCVDCGHAVRAGADVPAAIKAAGPRALDMHIKDLTDFGSDNSGCPVGDGKMPIPAIFKALIEIGFKGQVMLEYEIDETNPLPGMVKSFAYMRGVLAGMGYKG
ncbi:MAG: sugar phosphate isomerase/epimerase [Bryobacteraceae bacterium]|jgi:sugar phosphate isomerase/epimerase